MTDAVDALITAAASTVTQEIFKVGSGGTYSVNQVVDLLGGARTYIPKRPGEPDCTFADTAKIKKVLNWQPKVSLSQGVQTMLDNIEYWRNAPVWNPESIKQATTDWFKYLQR